MVNTNGQLYTIEGIAASLLLLVTTYFVLGGTTVFAPGESHVTDLQLEQIASDVLIVLDTPWEVDYIDMDKYFNAISPLENFTIIMTIASPPQKNEAKRIMDETVLSLLNKKVNMSNPSQLTNDILSYHITCQYPNGTQIYEFGSSIQPRQNIIRVTRLVNQGTSSYLVEMSVWRN